MPLGRADGRTAWTVTAPDGRVLAVFAVDGDYRVTDAACPHARRPLVEGWIENGTTLVCPGHRFRYDLHTGACANHQRYDLRMYPVQVRDGEPHAGLGDR